MPVPATLQMPAVVTRSIKITGKRAVSFNESPYNFAAQHYRWPGQKWLASADFPPLLANPAEEWVAFLLECDGPSPFFMGDPARPKPRGTYGPNMLKYSQNFDNAAWAASGVVVTPNNVLNPLGTANDADTCVFGEDNPDPQEDVLGILEQVLIPSMFGTYRFIGSIFAKAPAGTVAGSLQLTMPGKGVVASKGFLATTQWQRFNYLVNLPPAPRWSSLGTDLEMRFGITTNVAGATLHLWGAQFEPVLPFTLEPSAYVRVDGRPQVNGAGQTGMSLSIDNFTNFSGDAFKKGDYFQLGVGDAARLYKFTQDINAAGAVKIWPALRSSPADNAELYVHNCAAPFVLATGSEADWQIDEAMSYGIKFNAMEKV